jgi:hypothetical protein
MQELDSNTRDRLFEKMNPTDEAFPPNPPDPEPWWKELEFDSEGSQLEYQGERWTAEELATADPALARFAAELLKDETKPADVNNRACALVYADATKLEEPRKLWEDIPGKSKADANLKVLKKVEPAPAVAADR